MMETDPGSRIPIHKLIRETGSYNPIRLAYLDCVTSEAAVMPTYTLYYVVVCYIALTTNLYYLGYMETFSFHAAIHKL